MAQDAGSTATFPSEVDQPGGAAKFPDGMPPTRTIERMRAPPDSDQPTTAQLKADIDSGRTGDKVGAFDPGLSPLGTDDEAAGTPASPARIRLARRLEGVKRWAKSSRPRTAHQGGGPAIYLFVGAAITIGAVMTVGIILVR